MSASHTPGPWMAYKNPAQKEASEEQWSIGLADSFEKYGFIGISGDAYMMVGGVCTEADACLMAAAPELKASVSELLEELELNPIPDANCRCHISAPCNDCVNYGSLREVIKSAYAALARAKGKS